MKGTCSYISWFSVIVLLFFHTCTESKQFKTLEPVRTVVSGSDQTTAINELLVRVLGDRSKDVKAEVLPEPADNDYVFLQTSNGLLHITGSSGASVAYGLNYFLKYFCRKQMSWAGDQMKDIPQPFPTIPGSGIFIKAGVKYRYYQNVCTVSYSSVWWNWTRWEREIDWMALNGINLPLAFTGQEAIWDRVYTKLGFSKQDINEHFAGPAFLAWGRMGNIHGWGGPLPDSWKQNQLALQHKILQRMRSLGIIPVLPGFAGHVPASVTKLYPKAQVSKLSSWSHFNCTYSCTTLLEPDDPLFKTIGSMFIEEQMKEYNGTNHIYNADTFNEMIPRSNNVSYLSNASNAVFAAMAAADPDAIWLMQGWLFHNAPYFWKTPQIKALVTAVPLGRLLILDLFSESYPQYERANYYYGQPYIWCMLHDFGGNPGFYGKLDIVNNRPLQALTTNGSNMVGTGVTPEGINQNYVVYDLMLESGFTVQPVNLTYWLAEYAMRRYNSDNTDAIATWLTLGGSIYNDTNAGFPAKSLIRGSLVKRPSLSITPLPYWYNYSSLQEAWKSYMKALPHLPQIETTAYDTVDITRQMLQAVHRVLYYSMIEEYERKKNDTYFMLAYLLLDLLDDLDRILSTDSHFMMGCWIRDARALGSTDAEKDLYEYNARNQVTLWGPRGEILDYADKHWASLVSHYYKPRWTLFVSYLNSSLESGAAFNQTQFSSEVFTKAEEPFTLSKDSYPTTPQDSPFVVATELYEKWKQFLVVKWRCSSALRRAMSDAITVCC